MASCFTLFIDEAIYIIRSIISNSGFPCILTKKLTTRYFNIEKPNHQFRTVGNKCYSRRAIKKNIKGILAVISDY